MGHEIVLFHSALGLRPAVIDFAHRLGQGGHTVHTPDLFDGETFDNLADGTAKRDSIGIDALIGRAQAAVSDLSQDVVYVGFSMGVGAAEFLAATRPGAKGAILMHGAFDPAAFGIETWPGIPVQVHYATGDPEVEVGAVEALAKTARESGASVDVHAYDRGGHLFEDPDYEGYDADAASQAVTRVLGFLDELDTLQAQLARGGRVG